MSPGLSPQGGSHAYHPTQPYGWPDHRIRERGQGQGQYQGQPQPAIHGRDRTRRVNRRHDDGDRLSAVGRSARDRPVHPQVGDGAAKGVASSVVHTEPAYPRHRATKAPGGYAAAFSRVVRRKKAAREACERHWSAAPQDAVAPTFASEGGLTAPGYPRPPVKGTQRPFRRWCVHAGPRWEPRPAAYPGSPLMGERSSVSLRAEARESSHPVAPIFTRCPLVTVMVPMGKVTLPGGAGPFSTTPPVAGTESRVGEVLTRLRHDAQIGFRGPPATRVLFAGFLIRD